MLIWQRRTKRPPPLLSEVQYAGLHSLDDAATQILRRVRALVNGRAYYAYWLADAGDEMQLRSRLMPRRRRRIAPDYSGLVIESGPTLPAVPLSVPVDRVPEWPRIRDTGRCRWLDLPLGQELLVTILLLPPGTVSRRQLDRLIAVSRGAARETRAIYRRFRAAGEAAAGIDGATTESPPTKHGDGKVDGAGK